MAKSKSKARKIIIFALIIVVIGGLTAAALLRKREVVIVVQTEKVTPRTLTELVVANGRIQPVTYVKISPEVSGEIIELPVKEGQAVKKGDLLVKIKPDVYTAQMASAEASYRSALASKSASEANLVRSESEFRRLETLFQLQTNLVSASDFTGAKATFNVSQANLRSSTHQVEMSKASLDRAAEDLSKTVIYSPLDGTVIKLNSQRGERVVGTAMMAGTEMMTIADLGEMEARVEVGEIDVPLMKIGQIARLETDAFKDHKFNGEVTEIANSSRGLTLGSSSGNFSGQSQDATKFEIKVRIKDKEAFRPGMSVTAEIETRYRTNVLTVPIASVTTRLPKSATNNVAKAGTTNAPVATKSSTATNAPTSPSTNAAGAKVKPGDAPKPIEVVFLKDGEVSKMVPVKRGISDDSYTEITEGLKEGDEVVSGGFKAISRELEDGKKIKIGPPPGDKTKPEEKK